MPPEPVTQMSVMGQSRPGRAGSKSGHVRSGADSIRRCTVARGVRYAAAMVTNEPSRITERSVSPLSVPTSSVPIRRL
jgi:hypothetical protein